MPSNKTRSKSKSPRSSGTRKQRGLLAQDPLFQAMMNGKVLWGDIMMNEPSLARAPSPIPKANSGPRALSPHWESDVMEGFRTPDLRLRKGIYENFPVVVNEIRPGVYEVKWHQKNLEEWRRTHPASWDEYQEYEVWTEFRLLHSLRRHEKLYELLPPEKKDQIVLFRMKGEAARNMYRGPKLMRLNDIKEHFPVVWRKVQGRGGESTYALELRGDFLRRVSAGEAARMKEALIDALSHSNAWKVLPAEEKGEACRIEMKHEK